MTNPKPAVAEVLRTRTPEEAQRFWQAKKAREDAAAAAADRHAPAGER